MSKNQERRARRAAGAEKRAARGGLLQFSASFRKDLMIAVIEDRQRGLRGCTIVVGDSSLHAHQQPAAAHEPTPERRDAVCLLTDERRTGYTTVIAPDAKHFHSPGEEFLRASLQRFRSASRKQLMRDQQSA